MGMSWPIQIISPENLVFATLTSAVSRSATSKPKGGTLGFRAILAGDGPQDPGNGVAVAEYLYYAHTKIQEGIFSYVREICDFVLAHQRSLRVGKFSLSIGNFPYA